MIQNGVQVDRAIKELVWPLDTLAVQRPLYPSHTGKLRTSREVFDAARWFAPISAV